MSIRRKMVREVVAGELYEFFPLGTYVVSAPAVCRGRPTFKYTRIEVSGVLQRLGAGCSLTELIAGFQGRISEKAVREASKLAARALQKQGEHLTASHDRAG